MRITTIINGKGGVGKTTTTHILATGLDKTKYKTLAVDYDPSGNLSYAFGANISNCPTMYHVFNGDTSIQEAIQSTPQGDIIASNASLSKLTNLFGGDDLLEGVAKLKEQLACLSNEYTHIFIDSQPTIGGIFTLQPLTAANDLVIPMEAEIFSVQGLSRLQQGVESVKKYYNSTLSINGILLTSNDLRTNISKDIKNTVDKWAKLYDTKVYNTFIRIGVCVREAQSKQQSLFDYAPKSKPAEDFLSFIKEYLQVEEDSNGK